MATLTFTESPPRRFSALNLRADESDGDLLDRFIENQDPLAFEELVCRHGPMVLGVCRRVLDNAHDAEDCFQAVFLVLVRKAASVRPRGMVGNWLYGVAYRTALEARKLAARRRIREKKRCAMPRPEARNEDWEDLQPLLDLELAKLPDKYRGVLISCDLEGQTRKEVAHALGLPEGTVASRLARARVLLAKRLSRRNLAISAAALASLLSTKAPADVPPRLSATTTQAAAQLASGQPIAGLVSSSVMDLTDAAVRSLLWSKLMVASAVSLLLLVLGIGFGTLLPAAFADRSVVPVKPETQISKPEHTQETRDCVIQQIDSTSQTIKAYGDELHEIHLGPATKIVLDGVEKKFSDLQIGMVINLEIRRGLDGCREALRVEIVGEAVIGIVEGINADSVTIRGEADEIQAQQTYLLEKGVKLTVNRKKAKHGDVKLKMRVILHVAPGMKVLNIKAAGPKVSATVKSVQLDKRLLTLDIHNTNLVIDGTAVAADAEIVIDGKKAAFTELQAGMRVTVEMSAEFEGSCVVGVTARTQVAGGGK